MARKLACAPPGPAWSLFYRKNVTLTSAACAYMGLILAGLIQGCARDDVLAASGAYWGESGIPQEWREGLARPDMIEKALRWLIV